jgi:MFS family permease
MVPLTLLLRRRPPPEPGIAVDGNADTKGLVLGLRPNHVQALLWLAVIGCCGGMAVPIVHLVSHATDLGHSTTNAAGLLSVLFVAAFVSRICFGMLADRIGGMQTLLIGSVCQTALLVTFSMVESLPGLYVGALLFGLGFAGIMPCYPLIIRTLFRVDQVGWRIATQYLFASLGMALGGWYGGAVFDVTGTYRYAFLLGAALGVMNFALVAWLLMRTRRIAFASQVTA